MRDLIAQLLAMRQRLPAMCLAVQDVAAGALQERNALYNSLARLGRAFAAPLFLHLIYVFPARDDTTVHLRLLLGLCNLREPLRQ